MAKSILLQKASSQYLHILDTSQAGLDITGDFTIESWVKKASDSATAQEFATKWTLPSDKGYRTVFVNDALRLYTSNDGVASVAKTSTATVKVADLWVHCVWVYDAVAGSIDFYKNGSFVDQQTGLHNSLFNSASDFFVGTIDNAGTKIQFFDGNIFDLRVWSDKRTPTEITNNYQNLLTGLEPNLEANWIFNDSYLDNSPNNNTLVPINAPTFVDDTPYPIGGISTATGNFLYINRICEIYRFIKTGDKEEYDTSPFLSNVKFQIIPAGSDILAVFPSVPSYALHEMFCFDLTEIKNGDKVIDEEGSEYIIRGEPQRVITEILKFQQFVGEKLVGD